MYDVKECKYMKNTIESIREEYEYNMPVEKEDYYVLISGSRTYNPEVWRDTICGYIDKALIDAHISPLEYNIIIVSGGADGIDSIAEYYADLHSYNMYIFPAQWNIYGSNAGFIRNEIMHKFISQYPNRVCICIKDVVSNGNGTTHSRKLASIYGTKCITILNSTANKPNIYSQEVNFKWANKE